MAAGPDSLSRLGELCADACPRSESANCEDSKPSYTIELKFPGRCEIVATRPRPVIPFYDLPASKPTFDPDGDECSVNFDKHGDYLPT